MANLILDCDENASVREKRVALRRHLQEWRSRVDLESLSQQRENAQGS